MTTLDRYLLVQLGWFALMGAGRLAEVLYRGGKPLFLLLFAVPMVGILAAWPWLQKRVPANRPLDRGLVRGSAVLCAMAVLISGAQLVRFGAPLWYWAAFVALAAVVARQWSILHRPR